MKTIKHLFLIGIFFLIAFPACKDDVFTDSIFETETPDLDPDSYTYPFDCWLFDNMLKPYNLVFLYQMEDRGTDMDYNLVPTTYENSIDMALLLKYLWIDAYNDVADEVFMKANCPKVVHLIGSPAFNPVNGTMILGLAEGGLKVSLFRCNSLDYTDILMMNEFYFKTMHHEFAHILHQKKLYPREFRTISSAHYDPNQWQDRDDRVVASLGFASPYGSSQVSEDFVEIIANYIVKSDADWNKLLEWSSKGWNTVEKVGVIEGEDRDGVDGHAVLLQKLDICRTWMKDAWNIDLDSLRSTVQRRQNSIDIEVLRKQIDQYNQ